MMSPTISSATAADAACFVRAGRFSSASLTTQMMSRTARAQSRQRINALLAETQAQAVELQAREEELRAINEELEAKAERLRVAKGSG